jgi:hypothetical protein
MFHQNTNTAAPSVRCLHGANSWDLKSLELFAIAKKSTQCGSGCRTTLSCNGALETEANGACGANAFHMKQITATSFYERGFE